MTITSSKVAFKILHNSSTRTVGILYGLGAGALWGLVFIAPDLVRTFNPLQLSIARYFCYGLISAALIIPRWKFLVSATSRKEWMNLAWLAFCGNILYYLLLSTAVQTGGIAMTSLVIGFLPVCVTIIGSREHNAVPLRKLLPSLLLCACGAVCIGWQTLAVPSSKTLTTQLIGLFCAIGALVSWTLYAVGNARCLGTLKRISAHEWNLLTGIVTGLQSVLLIPFALLLGKTSHTNIEWVQFFSISIGVAALASITGNALWNRMSRLLPLTLVGQMILFETLFALIYGFLWEQRLPTAFETSAFVLVVCSVMSCITAHKNSLQR